jgi:hypothetical protein
VDLDAWAAARRIAETQRWLVTAEQLRACNLSLSEVATWLRSGAGRAVLRGVYLVDTDMYDDLDDATWWRAALLRHGPDAMLVGRTGARALGVQGLPPSDPVLEVAVVDGGTSRVLQGSDLPGGEGRGPEVMVRQWVVAAGEVVLVDGLRVRAAPRTVVDAALQLDRVHQLCVLDSALYLELVDEPTLECAIAAARRRRGCVRLRETARLADGRAESPLESRVRLACIDGDVAPDELQWEVRLPSGVVIAVGDLAWVKARRRPLLGEADGEAVHGRPQAVYRDRRRGNSLVPQMCDTVRFVWEDALRPAYIRSVVRACLAAG